MPTLYALLVVIDNYPDPRHVLRGCINDGQHIRAYLQEYCGLASLDFRPLALTDQQATRAGIIAGFGHFQAAEADDPCLFYFSGHGSRSPAPEAFWHLEPDHLNDSLVCWDSRQPGGHDLMDKELSFLIWQAGESKNLPFVTITDCCHSGSLRDLDADETQSRQLRSIGPALPAEEYLGAGQYKKSTDGAWSPPRGRRVHLAASRDKETAKEVLAGGVHRGIFSYCLVEALQRSGPFVSYAELLGRVRLRLRNQVADQSPQLETTFGEDKNLGFLSGAPAGERKPFLVFFDSASAGWKLNAGVLHGISAGDDENRTVLELPELGQTVEVTAVQPGFSLVSGIEHGDTKRQYRAIVRRRGIPRLKLGIAPGCDPEGVNVLTEMLTRKPSDLFCITEGDCDFLVHARDRALWISRLHNARPLFQRAQGFDETAIEHFLRQMETVASWQQALNLDNPAGGIRDAEIAVELYRVTEPGVEEDDAPVELVDWQTGPVLYRYSRVQEKSVEPDFQLKIRNTGHRTLWVGLLYLGSDFSIDNALCPKQALEPGQEVWALDHFKGYPYRTIRLQIDEDGVSAVDEYLKVLIGTEELDTDLFRQKGLTADTAPRRGFGRVRQPEQPDWAAKTLHLRIERANYP